MARRRTLSFMLLFVGASAVSPLAAAVNCRDVPPKDTNPALDEYLEEHLVCVDPAAGRRDRLLVFLPGTRAMPHRYSMFIREAAAMGLHAIGLRYANMFAINYEVCPYMKDASCYEDSRAEILYGQGVFEPLDIGPGGSAVGRLTSLLAHLHRRFPAEGWGQYLGRDGKPIWSSIVIAGQSQGGGNATMIARDNPVARLINFAWSDRYQGKIAPWLTEPFATPAEDLYVFEHMRDRIASRRDMWPLIGIDRLGPETSVDGAKPPFGGSHILTTDIEPSQSNTAGGPHNSVVVDDFTPLREDGTPVLDYVWRHLLDVPAGRR